MEWSAWVRERGIASPPVAIARPAPALELRRDIRAARLTERLSRLRTLREHRRRLRIELEFVTALILEMESLTHG